MTNRWAEDSRAAVSVICTDTPYVYTARQDNNLADWPSNDPLAPCTAPSCRLHVASNP